MLNLLDLFSGIGGFSLGLERTGGFKTAAFCEIDPAAQRVLRKHWPDVPVFSDITTIRKESLNGLAIDAICGGFPCQDISYNGVGAGLAGARSGLWWEMHRLIKTFRPQWVVAENVAALRSRGLDEVLRSLAEIGYDAEWHCIPASAVGAAHQRDRVWIVAYPAGERVQGLWPDGFQVPHSLDRALLLDRDRDGQRQVEPDLRRGPYGFSTRLDGRLNSWMDRIKQCGNAVVPDIPEMIGRQILKQKQQ